LPGGKVVLDLLYGDSKAVISRANFQADAWFLDGFAPARNPEMWADDLFELIAARTAPGGTVASFTAAGQVRRGLEAAGFTIHRRDGYGTKRHRIMGQLADRQNPDEKVPGKILVIGAGIAGASVASALQRRGLKVTVMGSGSHAADGASGNRVAVQAPRLTAADTPQGRFSLAAYGFARRLARQTGASLADSTVLLAWNEREQIRQEKIAALGWPDSVFRHLDKREAEAITGHGTSLAGMVFPEGGTVSPPRLVEALLKGVELRLGAKVHRLSRQASGWEIDTSDGVMTADKVVLAMGAGLLLLAQPLAEKLPAFQATAGHVSYIPEEALKPPSTGMSFGGYMAGLPEGGTALGASFDHHDPALPLPPLNAAAHLANHALLPAEMKKMLKPDPESWGGRTSLRLAAPDRHPLAGQLDEGLYTLTALGARGMVTGPMLGEYIAALIAGEPSPLDRDMEDLINPLRFSCRKDG